MDGCSPCFIFATIKSTREGGFVLAITHLDLNAHEYALRTHFFRGLESRKMTADSQSPSKGEPKDVVTPSQVTDSGPEATPAADKTTETQVESKPASETEGDNEESKEKELLPVGSVTESHNLFAKYDKDGKRSWSATMPTHIEEAAENDETKKFAVIVRKRM